MKAFQQDFSIERLLQEFLESSVVIQDFCSTFEDWWNFDADKTAYDSKVKKSFEHLFDVVSWYTDVKTDLAHYSGYTNQEKVIEAAKIAYEALLIKLLPRQICPKPIVAMGG